MKTKKHVVILITFIAHCFCVCITY